MRQALEKKALLVTLNISTWTARTLDIRTTNEVLVAKNADASVGRFSKSLLPNNTTIKAIRKNAGAARHHNYEQTLPWSDNGARIIPTARFMEHSRKMGEFKAEQEKLVSQFKTEYTKAIKNAKVTMGDLFDETDYPNVTAVNEKFDFDIEYVQVPISEDFRVDLAEEEVKKLKAKIDTRKDLAIHEARKDMYTRLQRVVGHMAEKLADPKGKFKNTLTKNVADLTQILDDLNIAEDKKLSSLGDEASTLGKYNPQTLRDDPEARKKAAEEAKDLTDKIAEAMKDVVQ